MSIALLKCNHTAYYDPEPSPGDVVYCRKCFGYSQVKVGAQEWLWKCNACHTSRRFGTDETTARGAARRHQRKYHHVVLLKHGYETVAVVGPEGQQELSVGAERIQWVATHQGALRALVEKTIVQKSGQSSVEHQP